MVVIRMGIPYRLYIKEAPTIVTEERETAYSIRTRFSTVLRFDCIVYQPIVAHIRAIKTYVRRFGES